MPISVKQYPKKNKRSQSRGQGQEQKKKNWQELLNKEITLFGGSINLSFRESFYAELSILLSAGLDLQKALELIKSSRKKKPQQELIHSIYTQVIEGDTLSTALKKSAKFSDYEIYSLQIGEEGGNLIIILDELASFFAKSVKYRQQLLGAISYPSFVISFAFLVIIFLLNYLVPMFGEVYQRFDGELPAITLTLINISDWIGLYIRYVFLSFIAIGIFLYTQRQKIWFRKSHAFFLLNIPLFGGIFKRIYLSRFCQSMYFLLGSKVPLLKTVELVKKMVGFYPIELSLTQAEKDILQGHLLHHSLEKNAFYPPRLIALLKVGEEASNMDMMFEKLAKQYNDEVEQKTATIGSLIEPVLIVGLGLLVGFILVAMYMPLFQLSVGVG